MGRKPNTKGKEKRLQRKEEQMRISAARGVIDAANKLEDPLAPFPVFRKYNKRGLDVDLSVQRVTNLPEETVDWVFNLTKRNMEEKYVACRWGWSDKKKREEMTEDSAWYLIAKGPNNINVAFSHFRFDMDCGMEVLYCYELQIEERYRRRGLGKFMMQILELVAFTNNLKKVILTVLKNNSGSKAFYSSLNYKVDETSPENDEENDYTYEILSKLNKRLLPEPSPAVTSKTVHNTMSSFAMQTHCCSSSHCH